MAPCPPAPSRRARVSGSSIVRSTRSVSPMAAVTGARRSSSGRPSAASRRSRIPVQRGPQLVGRLCGERAVRVRACHPAACGDVQRLPERVDFRDVHAFSADGEVTFAKAARADSSHCGRGHPGHRTQRCGQPAEPATGRPAIPRPRRLPRAQASRSRSGSVAGTALTPGLSPYGADQVLALGHRNGGGDLTVFAAELNPPLQRSAWPHPSSSWSGPIPVVRRRS